MPELKKILVSSLQDEHQHLPAALIDQLVQCSFEEADTDGNGKIDFQEFAAMARKHPMSVRMQMSTHDSVHVGDHTLKQEHVHTHPHPKAPLLVYVLARMCCRYLWYPMHGGPFSSIPFLLLLLTLMLSPPTLHCTRILESMTLQLPGASGAASSSS